MKIAIVDYGLGNIFSIQRAVRFLGHSGLITADPEGILASDRVILPGVGAFGDAMQGLRARGLDQVLVECVRRERPILGVCLGMQLLLSSSEEFGFHEGLGLIPGQVKHLPVPEPAGLQYKIPHVGWSQMRPACPGPFTGVLSRNSAGDYVYFVHSLRALPEFQEDVLATSVYGGVEFCCAVQRGLVSGVQFHPELSSTPGLKIYAEFLDGHQEGT